MNLINKISFAVLIADFDSKIIVFQNAAATDWIGDAQHKSLLNIFPCIDEKVMDNRLNRAKHYNIECKLAESDSVRNRFTQIKISRISESEYQNHILIECSDITKVREQEVLLESYLSQIKTQMKLIEESNQKNEKLLLNILPHKIMEELRTRGTTTPETFSDVTIMFVDFINFTDMEIMNNPTKLFNELNEIYTMFDDITTKNNCERIKTIGDAYLAVCGLPEPNPDHARNIARTALEIVSYLKSRNTNSTVNWRCRVGIHSGPVIGGIVGIKKYIYDVFGDAINTANRMQSNSDEMKINISSETHLLLNNNSNNGNDSQFRFTARGKIDVKGKGEIEMYFLES